MRRRSSALFIGLVPLLGISLPASADKLQDAIQLMRNIGCTAARETWLPLAEKGDAVAQLELGFSYEGLDEGLHYGDGCQLIVESEAVKWYKKAAEQGNAEAEAMLGATYLFGGGVYYNYYEGMRLLRESANGGIVESNFTIGLIFANGSGVPQDYAEAAQWYRRGAERGDFDSQQEMGGYYELGRGVPQDYVEAHMWYNLAAAHTDVYQKIIFAAKLRDTLAAKMTPAQIAEAQKRAREWRPK
jgi:hypothetical protein